MTENPVIKMVVRIGEREIALSGRQAWAIDKLIEAGPAGLTTADLPPGLRWSEYIRKLRRAGVSVDMTEERHGGAFKGTHGRYRLSATVETVAVVHKQDAARQTVNDIMSRMAAENSAAGVLS